MSDLIINSERLINMLSNKSDVMTYEAYSRIAGEDSIGKVQWDSLLTIVGTKQMLHSRAMKDAINRVQHSIESEKCEVEEDDGR